MLQGPTIHNSQRWRCIPQQCSPLREPIDPLHNAWAYHGEEKPNPSLLGRASIFKQVQRNSSQKVRVQHNSSQMGRILFLFTMSCPSVVQGVNRLAQRRRLRWYVSSSLRMLRCAPLQQGALSFLLFYKTSCTIIKKWQFKFSASIRVHEAYKESIGW